MRKLQKLPGIALPEIALTRKQATAIKKLDNSSGGLRDSIVYLIEGLGNFKDVYKPLNEVPLDYLIKVLVTREYHVEETFEEWLEGQKNRVVDGTPASCAYQIVLEEYKKRKEKGEF